MAFERGDTWLSYEVWKVDFYPQVAWKNLLWPFTLFSPRICHDYLSLKNLYAERSCKDRRSISYFAMTLRSSPVVRNSEPEHDNIPAIQPAASLEQKCRRIRDDEKAQFNFHFRFPPPLAACFDVPYD